MPTEIVPNLYITLEHLDIECEDWFLTKKKTICKCIRTDEKYVYSEEAGSMLKINCEKIILTTDDKLADDGVQYVADDFLEWLANNKEAKEIKVYNYFYKRDDNPEWRFIFPKNENKPETSSESNQTTAIKFLEWYRRKGVNYQFHAYHIQGNDETIYLNVNQLFEIFKKENY
jgi:hypothetical protein